MSKEDVEPFYLRRGEEFIDRLFELGYFREDVTRKELRQLDDTLGWLFQTQCNSAVRMAEINRDFAKAKK